MSGFNSSSLALTGFTQPLTTRGYTGHEMLDDHGLIHMNGRIFDPKLARFLQADPYIQAATDTQSYNRYTYVRNNPLNATDPSGYFWNFVIAAVVSYAAGDYAKRHNIGWLASVATIAGCATMNAAVCGGASFGSTYGATGNLGLAFVAGVAGAAMSGMPVATMAEKATRVLAGSMLAGGAGLISGGEFGHGFISAGIGSMTGYIFGSGLEGFTAATIVGGTMTEMTGGKFANGAATAAFSYAMSWAASKYGPGGGVEEWGYEYNDSDDVDAAVEQLRGTIKQTPDGNLEINATVSSSGSKGGNASRTRLFKLLNGKTFETDGKSLTVNLTEHNGDGVGDIHAVGQDEMRNRTTLSSKFNKKMARSGQSGKMECQSGCAVKMNGQSWVYIGGSLGSGGALHEVFHTYGVRHRTSGLMRTSGKTLTGTDVDILDTLYFGGR